MCFCPPTTRPPERWPPRVQKLVTVPCNGQLSGRSSACISKSTVPPRLAFHGPHTDKRGHLCTIMHIHTDTHTYLYKIHIQYTANDRMDKQTQMYAVPPSHCGLLNEHDDLCLSTPSSHRRCFRWPPSGRTDRGEVECSNRRIVYRSSECLLCRVPFDACSAPFVRLRIVCRGSALTQCRLLSLTEGAAVNI